MTRQTNLTERERQILKLLLQNKSNREIAIELSLSIETVKKHVRGILKKLEVRNRTEAVAKAQAQCLDDPESDCICL